MEKLIFWENGTVVESIGSMEEIRGMMDPETAYRVLQGCCYEAARYRELSKVLQELRDHEKHSLTCTPLEAARRIDAAQPRLPVPEDIFCFLHKAYSDGYRYMQDLYCAYDLGRLYSEERYGHVHYPTAAKWFTLAAAKVGPAETRLGECCLLGRGVPKDYARAFHYLVKGALVGKETRSLYLLGDMYRDGLYVERDPVQAFVLYQRAVDADDEETLDTVQAMLRVAQYQCDVIGKEEYAYSALALYQYAERICHRYRLSHPREAAECLERALQGQEQARLRIRQDQWDT